MSQPTADAKTTLAELASKHAKLSGQKDRAAGFRRRMIKGRAQSLIRKTVKGAAAQDDAFDDWQKAANATAGGSKTASPSKADASIGNALVP